MSRAGKGQGAEGRAQGAESGELDAEAAAVADAEVIRGYFVAASVLEAAVPMVAADDARPRLLFYLAYCQRCFPLDVDRRKMSVCARVCRISTAAMTACADRLAKPGLLTREEHPLDRRIQVLTVTEEGMRLAVNALRKICGEVRGV